MAISRAQAIENEREFLERLIRASAPCAPAAMAAVTGKPADVWVRRAADALLAALSHPDVDWQPGDVPPWCENKDARVGPSWDDLDEWLKEEGFVEGYLPGETTVNAATRRLQRMGHSVAVFAVTGHATVAIGGVADPHYDTEEPFRVWVKGRE